MISARQLACGLGLGLGLAGAAHFALQRSGAPCPVRVAQAGTLETERLLASRALVGERKAPTRTLMGLTLGISNEADVRARYASCATEVLKAIVVCENGSVLARLDGHDKLVGLDVQVRAQAAEALGQFEARAGEWQTSFGNATQRNGEASESFLAQPLRSAHVNYRFSDLALDLTVLNTGGKALLVRTQIRDLAGVLP
jgi:hypothetical protein